MISNMKISIGRAVLCSAFLLALSVPAAAAPKLYSMLAYDGTWNVVPGWTECIPATRNLDADAFGYDSSGNLVCSAATHVTGTWTVNSGSCTGAVSHVGHVRSSFLVDCTAPSVSWTTQNNCVYSTSAKLDGTSSCAMHTFVAYVQGLN